MICGKKELRTLVNISGQLDSVKRVIYMDDDIPSDASYIAYDWTITSFAKVVKLGSENSVDADLPLSADVAVIMYTSGSTGLPNVRKRETSLGCVALPISIFKSFYWIDCSKLYF